MAYTIQKALAEQRKGFHIGHRLIFPFQCQILKLIIDNEIYTEMVGGNHIRINQDPHNTSVYIRSAGRLSNYVGSYKTIKMVAAEMDSELCTPGTHIKLICEIGDDHQVLIHAPSGDDLFFE